METSMTDDAQRAEDDAGILAAAVALCWHARPVLSFIAQAIRERAGLTAEEWWDMQTEMERRLHIGRARVACSAWESYWAERQKK